MVAATLAAAAAFVVVVVKRKKGNGRSNRDSENRDCFETGSDFELAKFLAGGGIIERLHVGAGKNM